MDAEIRMAAGLVASKCMEIDRLVDERDEAARPLERAANTILRGTGQFNRAGQCAAISDVENEGGKIVFKVSNGYDTRDDFTTAYTVEQLEDAEGIVERAQAERTANKRSALEAQIEDAERELRGLGAACGKPMGDRGVCDRPAGHEGSHSF